MFPDVFKLPSHVENSTLVPALQRHSALLLKLGEKKQLESMMDVACLATID